MYTAVQELSIPTYQIETKFNFAVIRLFTQKMSMKKDVTHKTVIRPEWNIT